MKNFAQFRAAMRSIATIAMVAVIGVSFAALSLTGCDNGSTGGGGGGTPTAQKVTYTGTANGETYTLEITENTARYAAQGGDTYKLTVGAKTSTGTVKEVAGDVLTLAPSKAATATFTITITVSGSGITAITGTITFDNGDIAEAPAVITPGGGDSPYLGETPTLATGEQVYVWDRNDKSIKVFNGSLAIKSSNTFVQDDGTTYSYDGVTGAITNGKLTLSLGIPSASTFFDLFGDEGFRVMWTNINPPSVQVALLEGFEIDGSSEYEYIWRDNETSSVFEQVMYMYVANDDIITGKGGGKTSYNGQNGVPLTIADLNLPLKKGWNAVYLKETETTYSVSLGNPSHLKWVVSKN